MKRFFNPALLLLAALLSMPVSGQQTAPAASPTQGTETPAQQKIRTQAEPIQKQADELYKMFRDIPEFQQLMADQNQLQRLSNLYAQAASQGIVAKPAKPATPAPKESPK